MSRRSAVLCVIGSSLLVFGPVAASAPYATPVKGATYLGKTAQGKRVTIRISKDGSKITKMTIGWKAKCECVSGGPCGAVVNYDGGLSEIERVPVRQNGSFSVHGDATLKGKFHTSALAKGTWRERPLIPTAVAELQCDTGVIAWTVRRR